MSVWVVVGGQYGSEGKGKVSAFITLKEDIDLSVRCGGPNSGHSFVDEGGTTRVLRQLSTGYINPRTRLLIPAGALIDPNILKYEIDAFGIDPRRIGVDKNCFVITESDRETERKLSLRERLSSTLCGVGAAVARRALRGEDAKLAGDFITEYPWLKELLTDASEEVNTAVDHDKKVLIEGTQGFGLSLYHGGHYPKATSRDTSAAGFISEVGVSPRLVTEIVVVFRTFPIRVAGAQAGPIKDEITWEQIKSESGYPYDPTEMTSVTHKVRRVGRFDWELAKRAVEVNRPTRLAVNGLDYLDYRNFGTQELSQLSDGTDRFIRDIVQRLGVKVEFMGVGPGLSQIISQFEQVETVIH